METWDQRPDYSLSSLFTNLKGFTLAHAFSLVSFEGPIVMDNIHLKEKVTTSLSISVLHARTLIVEGEGAPA